MRRAPSLTLRLTLLFAAVSTAVLLVLGWIVGQAVERHFEEQDMDAITGKLELVRHALARVGTQAELDAVPLLMDDALVGHHGLVVAVKGPDGQVLFVTRDVPFPKVLFERAPDGRPHVWRDPDGHAFRGIAAEAPTRMAGAPQAVIAVATDISHHEEFLHSVQGTLWTVVAGAALATGLLGWFAARRGLAPLRAMQRQATEISAQRLDRRLPAEAVPAELAELAESLNEMLARLEDAFRRLSDFSSDIAHELRTPVSNLMTQTQVALSKARTRDEYRETLESNAEEFERLSRMIADMLFLAKADNGLVVPAKEPLELADEAAGLIEFYGMLAEDGGVSIRLDGQGRVEGDRLMLRRAIGNLLSNAIRHTPPGGSIALRIGDGPDGTVWLEIENDGEPIPAEHLPRLFDRFYRVDPSRQQSSEGAGLGLAITRSILRAHGGDVEARAGEHGNVFALRLPRRASHA